MAPNEVSVKDVHFHNTVLYCQGSKFMKVPPATSSLLHRNTHSGQASYFYDPFLTGPPGVFQSTDQAEHSLLRRLVSKPFSRKSILEFEPEIHDSVDELTQILRRLCTAKGEVDICKAFRCLSLDFITRFTYGESIHALQAQDFHEPILDAFDQFTVSNYMVSADSTVTRKPEFS